MKTFYYYQTFVGLTQIFTHSHDVDTIIISSIHFDIDNKGNKNMYLNDNLPYDKKFNNLWSETQKCAEQGITIILMIGGAGGAYTNLFNEFNIYYPQLKSFLEKNSYIFGVNLDIEESVSLVNVKMLINKLREDFGNYFFISMAPISEAMVTDNPGIGGFSYKELYNSSEGKLIDYFNVQCYDSFSFSTYNNIIKNGYPPEKIVMGMESGQFDSKTFQNAIHEINLCLDKYPNMLGVFDWEYLNAPPNKKDPSQWAKLIKNSKL